MRLKMRPCTTGQLLAALPAGARCVERSDATLTLHVAPAAKMATLRAVAQAGDIVEDVELVAPGLQELYAHLVGAAEQA
jgi:hypothetical protein